MVYNYLNGKEVVMVVKCPNCGLWQVTEAKKLTCKKCRKVREFRMCIHFECNTLKEAQELCSKKKA